MNPVPPVLVVSLSWTMDRQDRPTQLNSFCPENSKLLQLSKVHFIKKIFTYILQGTSENAPSHMAEEGFPMHKLFLGSYKAK